MKFKVRKQETRSRWTVSGKRPTAPPIRTECSVTKRRSSSRGGSTRTSFQEREGWVVPILDHSAPQQICNVKMGPPVKCICTEETPNAPRIFDSADSFLNWTNSFSSKEKLQYLGRQCVAALKVSGGVSQPSDRGFADAHDKRDWDKAAYGSTYISTSCLDVMVAKLGGRGRIFPPELRERRDQKGIHQVRTLFVRGKCCFPSCLL
jgi:hypothetical protein